MGATWWLFVFLTLRIACPAAPDLGKPITITEETIQNKIRGGLLGHLLGDLNGLQYEMKFLDEPGNVRRYTPALPDGAWTDDDTDMEWVYVQGMQAKGELRLAPEQVVQLWKRHINRSIWCANLYARQLMDLGFVPPETGLGIYNPWSEFNLSGQFVSESFGLISPGLLRTASELGVHYTRVAVEGEPLQVTQMFDAMIAMAFLTRDMNKIMDSGAAALDRKSIMLDILSDVRTWHRQHPGDWKVTRRLIKEKYSLNKGGMSDINGCYLNAASVIGALLYGQGRFTETQLMAYNFGWDCDNNAAMSGTIIGVIKGVRWMKKQDWKILDRYRNTSRDELVPEETITRFGDRLVALAHNNLLMNGAVMFTNHGKLSYSIPTQKPSMVQSLELSRNNLLAHRQLHQEKLESMLANSDNVQELARSAYRAICLDLAGSEKERNPAQWNKAISALNQQKRLLQVLFFESPIPSAEILRKKCLDAGVVLPPKS
jgi:hypothetical protein